MPASFWCLAAAVWLLFAGGAGAQEVLPGTEPLTLEGDLSARMVAGIDQFFTRETARSIGARQQFWHRDFASREAYERSVDPNRERLRKIIGAVDARVPVRELEVIKETAQPGTGAGPERETSALPASSPPREEREKPVAAPSPLKASGSEAAPGRALAETETFTVQAVRWPVFEGVYGEGLWLRPRTTPIARVIAVPDADQMPEQLAGLAPGLPPERQFARRLAENGCEVLVPVLIDRQDTWSGSATLSRFTNQPHREWIYRPAFELGRHIIGYEVQKILAAVDFFEIENQKSKIENRGIGVAGYAEGGLIAFYAAALDTRIDAVLVSGYFDSRQHLWEEPIYRNVFGLLREFGDAEIATLVAPRRLIVEYSPVPAIEGPPKPRQGRSGAAPGSLSTPDYATVEAEVERARTLLETDRHKAFDGCTLISGTEGMRTGPGSDRALMAMLQALGSTEKQLKQPGPALTDTRVGFDPAPRQQRQVKELEALTQQIFRRSEKARAESFWTRIKATSPQEWESGVAPFRKAFWEEHLGRLPSPTLPANPRARKVFDRPKWTGYEVVLDVYPDVFAWGYLLVPKDLKPGERRPAVVCQHGLEGLPTSCFNEDPKSDDFKYYKGFAAELAAEGFVVFAPHAPYRGHERFRQLQRKANPLQASLFSIIIAQHSRLLDWLGELPFVDARRIGFYGLSYGGTAAMRVPAVLDRYALSICSGNFNDWIRKNVSVDSSTSYLFHGEYEMIEFGLGDTFNHAEMAALIAPRPFMVERGHRDSVGLDEWVADEYAKVRRCYDQLGIPDRTAIEFFDGGHAIHGVGTFDFLRQHLDWPKRLSE